MKIKALHDNVLLQIEEPADHIGKIALPDNVKADDKYVTCRVLDVGPGRKDRFVRADGTSEQVLTKSDLVVGDRVMIEAHHAYSSIKDAEGHRLVFVASWSVLGTIEE